MQRGRERERLEPYVGEGLDSSVHRQSNRQLHLNHTRSSQVKQFLAIIMKSFAAIVASLAMLCGSALAAGL